MEENYKVAIVWPWLGYSVTEGALSLTSGHLAKIRKLDEPHAPTKIQEASHTACWGREAERSQRGDHEPQPTSQIDLFIDLTIS